MSNLQQPAAKPSLTIGGRTFTDLDNLIILTCYSAATGGGTFRAQGSSSGYQVTSGKTLRVLAVKSTSGTSTATPTYLLAQSDNDIGLNSATALTNPVYHNGSSASLSMAAGYHTNEQAIRFDVASGKYLSLTGASNGYGSTYIAYCYEV